VIEAEISAELARAVDALDRVPEPARGALTELAGIATARTR
jgi:hypothetical protein